MSKNIPNVYGEKKKSFVSVKYDKTDGRNELSVNIPKDQFASELKRLTCTESDDLAEEIIGSAIATMPSQSNTERNINSVLHVLSDFEPQDSIEAKLCLQAHSLYSQGMEYLGRASTANNPTSSQMFMNFALKLLRLNNETVEALSKYRRNGEQKVTIQHVNVEHGAQCIVGNVQTGGGV